MRVVTAHIDSQLISLSVQLESASLVCATSSSDIVQISEVRMQLLCQFEGQ